MIRQESTSANELQIAREFAREADSLTESLQDLANNFLLDLDNLGNQDDDVRLQVAVLAFIAAFEAQIYTETARLVQFNLELLKMRAAQSINLTEQQLLVANLRNDLTNRLDTLRFQREQTGLPISRVAALSLLPASRMRQLDMALDAITIRTSQSAVYDAGLRDQGTGKKSVAVIDNRTTDLCRNRMNGQVVAWDDYFEDPGSGARWLYPPFVGSTLPPAEIFHYCRTMIQPVRL